MLTFIYVIVWLLLGATGMVLGNRVLDKGKYNLNLGELLLGMALGPIIFGMFIICWIVNSYKETRIFHKVILKRKIK